MEDIGLEKDAEEVLELEQERRGKVRPIKKLTSSPKEAELPLKREMRLERSVPLGYGELLNSMA